MTVPVLTGIRIRYSESRELAEGQQFDTIAEFDATLRSLSASSPSSGAYFKIAFTVTWADGSTFQGRIDLQRHDYVGLAAHVARLCSLVERSPDLADLLSSALAVRSRVLHAEAQERRAACDRRIVALRQELAALREQIAAEAN